MRFWRALGFPMIEDVENERLFTPGDVRAMGEHAKILRPEGDGGSLNSETINMLLRYIGEIIYQVMYFGMLLGQAFMMNVLKIFCPENS